METELNGNGFKAKVKDEAKAMASKPIAVFEDLLDDRAKLKKDLRQAVEAEKQFVKESVEQIKTFGNMLRSNWKIAVPVAGIATMIGVGLFLRKKSSTKPAK